MGAAEDDGIGAGGDGGTEYAAKARAGGFGAGLAAFDEFGEAVPGYVFDADAAAELIDDTGVEVAIEGARGGEDGDAAGAGLLGGGFEAGHHADEGHGEGVAQVGDGGGGGRVTGDDDELAAGTYEALGDGEAALADLGGGAGAIGEEGGIGEVDDALMGGDPLEIAEDAKPANAGIEHPNRPGIHRG